MTATEKKPETPADAVSQLPDGATAKALTPEARRALEEAEVRRKAAAAVHTPPPAPEIGGRTGPDPARYGDWEKGGITSDF